MSSPFRDRLLEEMRSLRTVDCHSHTCLRRDYAQADLSLFSLMSYFDREVGALTGQGCGQLFAECASDGERWEALRGVLDRTRNVSYWRHNLVVYRELFDLADDELNDGNWSAVNECIKQRTKQAGWYEHVTNEVCQLETQIRNVPWFEDWEPEYFTAILRMESALDLCNAKTREGLAQRTGRSIVDLGSLKGALIALTQDYVSRGARGIKLAHAYTRTLYSEDVPESRAAAAFERALKGQELSPEEVRAFQDHLIFFLARLAGEMDLVFQIHTGVQGTWGYVPDSNPLHLLPLIHAHKDTRFDLFHAGYPYSRELGMLAKHCPNVWLNMCWMYVITMEGSRQSLAEWIDLVPGHRLLGFGSDVGWPEFIWGHLVMARSCLADVLAHKVKRDFLSEEAALDLVRKMLRENAIELYRLG
jgi:predicted TIM-barrel fold metal-dependent hydrolase